MEILSILTVFLTEFLIGLLGAKWAFSIADKMGASDGEGFSLPLGGVLLLSSFVCVSLVFGSSLGGANAFFLYAVMAMGLVIMVLADMKLPAMSYILGVCGICLISSYFLPSNLSIASGFGGIIPHIGLALAWGVLVWLFVQMDRVPFLSMTLSLVFAIFYFLLSVFLNQFEPAFGYLSITLVVVLLGINTYLKRGHYPKLGKAAATFVGFVWGAMATYVLASGHMTAIVVLYSYPIMETALSIIASVAVYQRFSPVYPFLIEQVIVSKPEPEKALKFIMRWEFLIACLAILAVLNEVLPKTAFYIALILFSINIYMRLKSWGEPSVRLRDVWSDAKESVAQLKVEIKKMADNQKKKKQITSDTNKDIPAQKIDGDKKKTVLTKVKRASNKKITTKKEASSKKVLHQSVKKSPKGKRGG